AIFAALVFLARRSIGLPAIVSTLATLLLAGYLLNVVGATQAQGDAGQPAAGLPTVGSDVLLVRGGTSLSGRDKLWRASVAAIVAKPLFGSGPGTNVQALAPYLDDPRYEGL